MNKYADKKVLLVDDSEIARVLIQKVLNSLGFKNVNVFDSSVEAWKEITKSVLDEKNYDLIITDLNMPDLDGMDLVSNLKQDKLSEKLNVVVVSAEADPRVMDILKGLGVCGYFSKPIDEINFDKTLQGVFSKNIVEDNIRFSL